MYKPRSLDQERISWKTVIYFNVVHSLKQILTTLEAWDDSDEDNDTHDDSFTFSSGGKARANGFSDHSSPSTSSLNGGRSVASPSSLARSAPGRSSNPHNQAAKEAHLMQIANLRRRLSPLIAADAQLADRLSGGINVSGSGKGGVFVRSGWQARTIENAIGKMKQRQYDNEKMRDGFGQDPMHDVLIQDVGRMLEISEEDILELWNHPTVKGLMVKRRLKLDEWSELLVIPRLSSNLSSPIFLYFLAAS